MCFEQIFCLGIALATFLVTVARSSNEGWTPRHPASVLAAVIPAGSIFVMFLYFANPTWTKANLPLNFRSSEQSQSTTDASAELAERNLLQILAGDVRGHELQFSQAALLLPLGALIGSAVFADIRKRKLTIRFDDRDSETVTQAVDPIRFWQQVTIKTILAAGLMGIGLFSTVRLFVAML